jgi:hypothetical protein
MPAYYVLVSPMYQCYSYGLYCFTWVLRGRYDNQMSVIVIDHHVSSSIHGFKCSVDCKPSYLKTAPCWLTLAAHLKILLKIWLKDVG